MKEINQDLEKSIVEATKELFSTMVMIEVTHLAPVDPKIEKIESNITSMIGLGGEIRGMLSIHCPEVVAKDITGSFLGMDIQDMNEDVEDAISEVANMIAGDLKIFFASIKINIELAIPTSVKGKSFRTSGLFGAFQIIIPFLCGQNKFWVEMKYVLNS